MKLPKELISAFDDQVTLEIEASIVYRQLAIEMDMLDLPGIASWFRKQAEEEIVHANKFIDHMTDRDAHPRINTIAAPNVRAENVLAAFEASLKHEERVSNAIRDLYRKVQAAGDIDAIPLLNWFVDEQIEEEATVSEIVSRVKLIHNDGSGLLRLDEELGRRSSVDEEAEH